MMHPRPSPSSRATRPASPSTYHLHRTAFRMCRSHLGSQPSVADAGWIDTSLCESLTSAACPVGPGRIVAGELCGRLPLPAMVHAGQTIPMTLRAKTGDDGSADAGCWTLHATVAETISATAVELAASCASSGPPSRRLRRRRPRGRLRMRMVRRCRWSTGSTRRTRRSPSGRRRLRARRSHGREYRAGAACATMEVLEVTREGVLAPARTGSTTTSRRTRRPPTPATPKHIRSRRQAAPPPHVRPGARLPGIPRERAKRGAQRAAAILRRALRQAARRECNTEAFRLILHRMWRGRTSAPTEGGWVRDRVWWPQPTPTGPDVRNHTVWKPYFDLKRPATVASSGSGGVRGRRKKRKQAPSVLAGRALGGAQWAVGSRRATATGAATRTRRSSTTDSTAAVLNPHKKNKHISVGPLPPPRNRKHGVRAAAVRAAAGRGLRARRRGREPVVCADRLQALPKESRRGGLLLQPPVRDVLQAL